MKRITFQLLFITLIISLTGCEKFEEWQSLQKQKKAVEAILVANGKEGWSVNSICTIRENRVVRLSWCKSGLPEMVIPEEIGELIYLETIWFYQNNIGTLPESFGNLVNLNELKLEYGGLTSLPESFGNLSSLETLSLHNNNLTSLPESFGNLHKLITLNLKENKLETLSENFGELESLEKLFCGSNELISLPASFTQLDNLEYCRLSDNNLTALPDNFHLKKLQTLRITDNQLTTLPESMAGMRASHIEAFWNPFKVFPSVVLKLPCSSIVTLGDSVDVRTIPSFYLRYRPNDIGGAFHDIGGLHEESRYISKVYGLSMDEFEEFGYCQY